MEREDDIDTYNLKLFQYILTFFLLALSLVIIAQIPEKQLKVENSGKYFFNEVYGSINSTISNSENTFSSRVGFGIGARRSFFNNTKQTNLTFDFEINRSSVFVENFDVSHFSSTSNVAVIIYYLTFKPLNIQLNFGSNKSFFIETGFFIDFTFYGKGKGTSTSFSPYIMKTTINSNYETRPFSPIFMGPSSGVGIKIPCNTNDIIIRLDYKHGLKTAGGQFRGGYSDYFKNSQTRLVVGINF